MNNQDAIDALGRALLKVPNQSRSACGIASEMLIGYQFLVQAVNELHGKSTSGNITIRAGHGRPMHDWVFELNKPPAHEPSPAETQPAAPPGIVFVPCAIGPRPGRFAAHFAALIGPGYVTCHGASESAVRRAASRANKAAKSRRYSVTRADGGALRLWLNPGAAA